MINVSIIDRRYTWSNLREDPCLSKLDKIMVSSDWEDKYLHASGKTCIRLTLDHVPLHLDKREKLDMPRRGFHFEKKMWLENPTIYNLIKEIWERDINATDATAWIALKLRRLRTVLRRLEKMSSQCQKQEGTECRNFEVGMKEENTDLSNNERNTFHECRKELEEIFLKEENIWRQRSRITWIKKEDRNMAFCHKVAKHRKR